MARSGRTPITFTEEDHNRPEISRTVRSPAASMRGARISTPPWPGLRPVGNDARDRQIQADHPAVVGALSLQGCQRASVRCHAPAVWDTDTREQGKALTGVAMPPHISHRALSALAAGTGMARATVHNISGTGRTSKVSRDPACGKKIHDVVGLYVNPPDRAVVLSMGENRRIQALSRTQEPPAGTWYHGSTHTITGETAPPA